MLALLSPAKKLDLSPLPQRRQGLPLAEPELLSDAKTLAGLAKKLTQKKLSELMDLSEALAELNWDRFQAWVPEHLLGQNDCKPAALTFDGEVYAGLDAPSLSDDDLLWMNDHVQTLSGLYGLLRPLDLMQPYRLEMGTALKNRRGADLYAFWGDRLAKLVAKRLSDHADKTLVNLASTEYMKAVPRKSLKVPVLDIAFKEDKDGKLVTLMLFAKRARGLMARYMVTNRIERREDLKRFDLGDYRFAKHLSTETEWVFTRPYRTMAMETED
jgi:cytoplasmic iron level regulating protein YaaA (DUF328/UPF0246 family)